MKAVVITSNELNVNKVSYLPASSEESQFVRSHTKLIEGTQQVAVNDLYRFKTRKRDEGVLMGEITNRKTRKTKPIYLLT